MTLKTLSQTHWLRQGQTHSLGTLPNGPDEGWALIPSCIVILN